MTDRTYILEATNAKGEFVYYNGRAGEGWVSSEIREAFPYHSIDVASDKARLFNRGTPLHGLTFAVLAMRSSAPA